jgi:hypothetical protein
MLPEVELAGLARHPSVAVEDVSDSDGLSDSDAVAAELRRTRLFDRVERVAVVTEAHLAVRGTIDRGCERVPVREEVGLVVAVASLVAGGLGSLASIPHYQSGDYGLVGLSYGLALAIGIAVGAGWQTAEGNRFRCTVASDFTVFRAGRPWRRYRDEGSIHLAEAPSTGAMVRVLARRLAARLARDLEAEESAP